MARRVCTHLTALALSVLVVPAAQAGPVPTTCVGHETVSVDPGLSALVGTSGFMTTLASEGEEVCAGAIDGHTPTGIIRTHHEIFFGTQDPDTCFALEGYGFAIHKIPVGDAIVEARNDFVFWGTLARDGTITGAFEGTRFSGRFAYRPVEGDCFTTPMTALDAPWVGTWHD